MPRKNDDEKLHLVEEASEKIFRVRAATDEARQIIASLGARKDELAQIPSTGREAVQMVAAQSLPDKLQASLLGDPSANLTPQQRTAALLLGQGMPHEDIAMGLEIPVGTVYGWDLNIAGFRQEAMRWSDMAEFAMGTRTRRRVDDLMDMDLTLDQYVKVLGLAHKIGRQPEERRNATVKMVMDAEKLKLARQHLAVKSGQVANENEAVKNILDKFGTKLMEAGAQADAAAIDGEFEEGGDANGDDE